MSLFPPDESLRAGSAAPRSQPAVLTVALLVSSARLILERHLGVVWVSGEISNLYRAPSGHVYFTLKDATAQVKCALWKTKAQLVDFALRDGLAVEVRALPSIYDQRGEFQLNVDAVRHAGLGVLYERFARLKAKLEAAGWLASERKRALPPFPRAVGVITSPRGAAVFDVVTTLKRRWPALRVIVYPAGVQGETAPEEIAYAIRTANARAEVDVLIVCRGGGSIEDLWAFNEERVAQAIHDSRLPIVSGVGHETDFTIGDFVADVRAPTPTAAAALVVPDCGEYRRRSGQIGARLARAGAHAVAVSAQRCDLAGRRLVHPAARLARQQERLAELAARLARCWARQSAQRQASLGTSRLRLQRELRAPFAQSARLAVVQRSLARAGSDCIARAARSLGELAQNLAHLNPQAVLERGYAIVATSQGEIVVDIAQLKPDDAVVLTLARGRAGAVVKDVNE
jgi:exodeoxyribonuclease VII large subunit